MSDSALVAPAGEQLKTYIGPSAVWSWQYIKDTWAQRHLLVLFAMRDITVRYKQTYFGFLWVVIQPIMVTVIYSIFFGRLANIPSDGAPYPVFVLSGVILWQFFSSALSQTSTSIVAQQSLISKIYFPRVIAVFSPVMSGLIDLGIMVLVLAATMLIFGTAVSWSLFLAPLFAGMAVVLAVGLGLWLSALDALYRDVRYALNFVVQIWYYSTPIIYPVGFVPEKYKFLLDLNPMTGIVMGFRWSILPEATPPSLTALAMSFATITALLVSGYAFFRRIENQLIDRV